MWFTWYIRVIHVHTHNVHIHTHTHTWNWGIRGINWTRGTALNETRILKYERDTSRRVHFFATRACCACDETWVTALAEVRKWPRHFKWSVKNCRESGVAKIVQKACFHPIRRNFIYSLYISRYIIRVYDFLHQIK